MTKDYTALEFPKISLEYADWPSRLETSLYQSQFSSHQHLLLQGCGAGSIALLSFGGVYL